MLAPRLALLLSLACAALASTACRRAAPAPSPPVTVEPAPEPSRPATRDERDALPHLTVALALRLEGRPALLVDLRARGLTTERWSIPALASATLTDLVARDDDGEIAATLEREGALARVRLARAPRGELRLAYVITPEEGAAAPEIPAGLELRLDSTRTLAAAEEVLLLPDDAPPARLAVELAWTPAPPHLLRLASTLGVEEGPREVSLDALRHAALLAGPLGTAIFRDPAGDDDFAWSGETSFDLRWSAAEIAGARTAVDMYFGAATTQRFTTLLAVDIDYPGDGIGVLVFPREGGLYVAISPGARWDARARLAVAQGLVHRWIGGRLRLDPEVAGPPEAGAWFDVGFGRAIAREVLVELGTLGADDVLDEVHGLVGELLTSPLREQGNHEVAALAAAGDHDALALLVARGALYAGRLDALLGGKGGLRALIREIVADARERRSAVVGWGELVDRIRRALDYEETRTFAAALLGGRPLPLPADLLGPCFAPAPRTYTRFELGFDAARSQAAEPPAIVGLDPRGPAARAGLREGERLHSVVADRSDPSIPAEVVVERRSGPITVTYRPRGASVRGQGWRRSPRADPKFCPP
ncbi:MAG: hypothetical protein H6710_11820 [Myxococcales bacterium]|nr:hypothetical protein [Myxococcales bacterium]